MADMEKGDNRYNRKIESIKPLLGSSTLFAPRFAPAVVSVPPFLISLVVDNSTIGWLSCEFVAITLYVRGAIL